MYAGALAAGRYAAAVTTPLRQAIAAPCFDATASELVDLAVQAEHRGFDGFFIWDHLQFSNDVDGPAVHDPWALLAVIADRTERIRIGPMVTPVSRRRPWVLARQTVTIDHLSNGRLTLGVGLGSPAQGDFARFGDAADNKERAQLLDEGLAVWAGLCSGEEFSYTGAHYRIEPTRFIPRPIQPHIPVWIGGVLPAQRPLRRAAAWDGVVPITYRDGRLTRPSAPEMAAALDTIESARDDMTGYDSVVWSPLHGTAPEDRDILDEYDAAGVTWWIETAVPQPNWQADLRTRIANGPAIRV